MKQPVDTGAEIPVFRPGFGEAELEALSEVFNSGWLGAGPKAAAFEEAFAEYTGASYAVSVTSGTAALHLACRAIGIGPGDEVLVPSLTFASTAHAPAYCGARVVFVEVDPVNCNLDPKDLQTKITPRAKAVIPVHYGGHPAPMEAIWEIAQSHGMAVIEDAAHACGARYNGQNVGALPGTVATCFSFNALKNLSTGDGGMLTTNSPKVADKARVLRWMGIEKNTFERTVEAQPSPAADKSRTGYQWFYELRDLGYKYIMNDVTACIGLAQLNCLEQRQAVRREMARHYSGSLAELEWLEVPVEQDYATSAWHLYPIRTDYRQALKAHLRQAGIATSVHYLPLHLQPYYRRQEEVSLPISEMLAEKLLSIPFHPNLTPDEVQRVLAAVRDFSPVATEAHR